MKPYELKRFYLLKLGKFVYKHKGSGIIVDNIFKPMKSVMSSVVKKFVKPLGKKAIKSGISHAGVKLGKRASEKAGDLIMKKLSSMRNTSQMVPKPSPKATKPHVKKRQESTNMIINRLISGDGLRR